MFDSRKYEYQETYDTAKEKRKIKKLLFNLSKEEFSNLDPFRMKYYSCVNECLHNNQLQGKNLDRAIVQCKLRLQKVEKYVNDINQHAKIKVQRCIASKRS